MIDESQIYMGIDAYERRNYDKAVRLIVQSGRSYATRGGRYVQMQLFSMRQEDVELVAKVFGGKPYRHKSGWQWVSSHRTTMLRIRAAVEGKTARDFTKRMRALYDCTPLMNSARLEMEKNSIVS